MNSLLVTTSVLLGSAVAIYVACEYFVNGVEWVGRKLSVGAQATGTILAAFGTALPESVVTFVAVVFGATPEQKEVGVGAALGGPLVLSTIGYAAVGLTLLMCRKELPRTEAAQSHFSHLSRDQAWFLCIFAVKIAAGVTVFRLKPWLGVLFLAAYAVYFWKEMGGEKGDETGKLAPLKITPKRPTPTTVAAVVQTSGPLALIFIASRIFVGQLDVLGPALGSRPQLLALLVSPIATELPETLNAIIWVRQGKYNLALANVSGAMMIQATVPTALGLFFTPWLLERPSLLAASITFAAVGTLFACFSRAIISRSILASMSLFYIVFAGMLITQVSRPPSTGTRTAWRVCDRFSPSTGYAQGSLLGLRLGSYKLDVASSRPGAAKREACQDSPIATHFDPAPRRSQDVEGAEQRSRWQSNGVGLQEKRGERARAEDSRRLRGFERANT